MLNLNNTLPYLIDILVCVVVIAVYIRLRYRVDDLSMASRDIKSLVDAFKLSLENIASKQGDKTSKAVLDDLAVLDSRVSKLILNQSVLEESFQSLSGKVGARIRDENRKAKKEQEEIIPFTEQQEIPFGGFQEAQPPKPRRKFGSRRY